MNTIETNINSNVAMNMLESTLTQSTEQAAQLTDELIKLNVENIIDINQLEYIGTVVDLYA